MPWPTLWLSRCAAFRRHDLIARPSYLGTPKLSKEPSGFSVGEKGVVDSTITGTVASSLCCLETWSPSSFL